MCKMLEDMRNEAVEKAAKEAEINTVKKMAIHLVKSGKISLEDIAEAAELPLEVVRGLEL